jgi:aquaporin Z
MVDAKKLGAEFLGTFWLVLGGCGSAVLAAKFLGSDGVDTNLGIGFVGVSLAFGLTVLTGAYAFGHVSGGHFNPAVTLGLVAGKRFEARDAVGYIVAQVLGALVAAGVLWVIALGQAGMTSDALAASGFASNGYGDHSPGGYELAACHITEIVLTAVFLFVILGATDKRSTAPVAGVAIGLSLTLIHLVSIPVTNTSVNPARSTGPAVLTAIGGESWPVSQLWLFWVAPIIGALIAGVLYTMVLGDQDEPLAEGVETA